MSNVIEGEFAVQDSRTEYGLSQKGLATPRQITNTMNREAKARLAHNITLILNGKSDRVMEWLEEVAKVSPAEAIRLYMELTEFVQPKLKAATVVASADFTPRDGGMSGLTIEQLEQIAAGGG